MHYHSATIIILFFLSGRVLYRVQQLKVAADGWVFVVFLQTYIWKSMMVLYWKWTDYLKQHHNTCTESNCGLCKFFLIAKRVPNKFVNKKVRKLIFLFSKKSHKEIIIVLCSFQWKNKQEMDPKAAQITIIN